MELNQATLQKLKIALARKSFYDYCNMRIPKVYDKCDYLEEICNEMQDFLENDLELLIINMPPRHAKTLTKDQFIPWALGQNKTLKFIGISYNQGLSRKSSKYIRNSIAEIKADSDRLVYSDVFPEVKLERGSASVDMWKVEGAYTDNYLASSPNGMLTGAGADMCFPAGTMVTTINGNVPIERLSQNSNIQILSYNHNCDTIELDTIVASRRLKKNEFITIWTEQGNMVRATREHRIFVRGKGYIRADEIQRGDAVISVCDYEVRPLWKNLHKKKIRIRQKSKTWNKNKLLFKDLYVQSEQRKQIREKILPDLWRSFTQRGFVLFGKMQKRFFVEEICKKKNRKANSMHGVWKPILSNKLEIKVLFNGLQKFKPFKKHDRRGKLEICKQKLLQERISRYANGNNGKTKSLLRHLWKKRSYLHEEEQSRSGNTNDFIGNTSQRQKQAKQFRRKPSCDMWKVSQKHTSEELVTRVELSRCEEFVYDIQVKNNNNFFANNILVHNCVIDDIVKNSYEAYHEGIKQEHFEFFTDTLYSRLEGLSKVILIMTRWATDDLAGRLIKMYSEQGRKFKVISKRAETDGVMLNPNILPFDKWLRIKQTIGENIANANYNQEPADLIGRLYGTFQTYKELPQCEKFIKAICDPADEGTDYLASVVYVVYEKKAFIIDIIFTQEPLEVTEKLIVDQVIKHGVDEWIYEKNFGGKSFGKNIRSSLQEKECYIPIRGYTQTQNKQARIYSNSTNVMRQIVMPDGWEYGYPQVYKHLSEFNAEGNNLHDDIEDVLTKIVELINQ